MNALAHTHRHTPYSVNTASCCFYSRGEPEEKKLRSELKHDSCTVSLSLSAGTTVRERAGDWRKHWEKDSLQRK